jgi:hypothetical protein
VGGRTQPFRYGGFETLLEVLSTGLSAEGVSVLHYGVKHQANSRGFARFFGLGVVGPFQVLQILLEVTKLRFRGVSVAALILNPVNIFSAGVLRLLVPRVVIHLDGRDDKRAKWSRITRIMLWLFQELSLRSPLTVLVDSHYLARTRAKLSRGGVKVIAYGGCRYCEARQLYWKYESRELEFLTLGRLVLENQLGLICRSFKSLQLSNYKVSQELILELH